MKKMYVLLVALCVTVLSCVDRSSGPVGLLELGRGTTASATECNLSEDRCDRILAGIFYLMLHPAAQCSEVGQDAYGRFMAPAGSGLGFKADETMGVAAGMGVRMIPGGGTPSGYFPSDGWIRVSESFWTSTDAIDQRRIGGVIAHEEGGHMTGQENPQHSTGFASTLGAACAAEY